MMEYLPQIIGLLSGAAGGNIAGKMMNSNMGTLGRSLTGIVGGAGLSFLAPYIPGVAGLFQGGADVSGIIGGVASGGIGGTILTFILGKLKG